MDPTPAPRPKAYSYLRFSTPEQSQGDSTRRQRELAFVYAQAHGLDLDQSSYQDLGVSAFRGKNSKVGALRAFLDAIEENIIPQGSFLLVESLDRISRDQILDAQGLFLQIVNAGVTLVTLADQRLYSRVTINANPTDLIISLLTMIRANEESATKSRRLKASWANKRINA
ncbi:MAG: recombinase family protein, partial [Planctomycetes bacterium]|nr:recombinase family protein [Planctomycetota bacterium]